LIGGKRGAKVFLLIELYLNRTSPEENENKNTAGAHQSTVKTAEEQRVEGKGELPAGHEL